MLPDRSARALELFEAAIPLDARQRAAFLSERCAGDPALRRTVDELLAAHAADAGSFLESHARVILAPPDFAAALAGSGRGSAPGSQVLDGVDRDLAAGLGSSFGDHDILEEIGRGGMGVVYKARQRSLDRIVALKVVLAGGLATQETAERFRREARATASIRHPNIVPVHEVGEVQGAHYYTMDFIEGVSLARLIQDARARTPLPDGAPTTDPDFIANVVRQFEGLAEGLGVAHAQGLVHRDIKPSNILVDRSGRYVLVDFGLVQDERNDSITRSGAFLGTLRYMSPEQVSRAPVDARSDVYGLGSTLYETVTLAHPVDKTGDREVQESILHEDPVPPRKRNRRVSADLETVILHALEKDPARRYPSAAELAADLGRILRCEAIRASPPSVWSRAARRWSRHRGRIALAATVLAAVAIAGALSWSYVQERRARRDIVRVIEKLDRGELFPAYALALDIERRMPGDPSLEQIWSRVAHVRTITTEPPGAEVFVRDYFDPASEWLSLGRTPIEARRLPRAACRWRFTKEGCDPFECGPSTWRTGQTQASYRLDASGTAPAGMALIHDREGFIVQGGAETAVRLPDYWIDRCEVTNAEFQDFVDAGGYRRSEYWKEELRRDGRVVPWDEAVSGLVDQDGHPGPSTWKGGRFPPGQGRHPVTGVSWFEAAAYAAFRGKSLPTVCHWRAAACLREAIAIARPDMSNFLGSGTAEVGTHPGMGDTGLHDMAGNAREWCHNTADEAGEERYILGGAWGEPTYMFGNLDRYSPWNRVRLNGFRCALYPGGPSSIPPEAFAPHVPAPFPDYTELEPMSDAEFEVYSKHLFRYDPIPLDARVESIDEGADAWRRERISFAAAYGGERVIAHLCIPRGARPPHQTVIYVPGDRAYWTGESKREPQYEWTEFVLRSGRAVLFPNFKGWLERPLKGTSPPLLRPGSVERRDWIVSMSKDLRRAVDYLETRGDIDSSRLAYFGMSVGAAQGPVLLATEPRLRAGVLAIGGLFRRMEGREVNGYLYAPRVRASILMVGGENDLHFPVAESQRVLFDALGTPHSEKRLSIYPGGHGLYGLFVDQVRGEILGWLDRCLGKVGDG